jgi:hypothetical protein
MAQWGKNDAANNAPIWAAQQLKVAPNTANRDALFGNGTSNGFIAGTTTGVYGISASEMSYAGGTVGQVYAVNVTAPGTGFTAVASVGFSGGGGSSAAASATMRLVSVTVGHGGNNYAPGDLLTVAGGTSTYPGIVQVNTTEVRSLTPTTGFLGTGYANGDVVTISTGTGTAANATVTTGAANTSVASLTVANGGNYTVNPTSTNVATTNTTGSGSGLRVDVTMKIFTIGIANTGRYSALPTLTNNIVTGGSGVSANINLVMGVNDITVTNPGSGYTSAPTVSVTGTGGSGQTAVAVITDANNVNSASKRGVAHSGWVLRTEGQGGRAGRVFHETLVAGGVATDASDDTKFAE